MCVSANLSTGGEHVGRGLNTSKSHSGSYPSIVPTFLSVNPKGPGPSQPKTRTLHWRTTSHAGKDSSGSNCRRCSAASRKSQDKTSCTVDKWLNASKINPRSLASPLDVYRLFHTQDIRGSTTGLSLLLGSCINATQGDWLLAPSARAAALLRGPPVHCRYAGQQAAHGP